MKIQSWLTLTVLLLAVLLLYTNTNLVEGARTRYSSRRRSISGYSSRRRSGSTYYGSSGTASEGTVTAIIIVVVVIAVIVFCVCCCSQLNKSDTRGQVIVPAPTANTGTTSTSNPPVSYTAANPGAVAFEGKPNQQYPPYNPGNAQYPPYNPGNAQYPPYPNNTYPPPATPGTNQQTTGLGQDAVPPPYPAAYVSPPAVEEMGETVSPPRDAPPPSYEDTVRH